MVTTPLSDKTRSTGSARIEYLKVENYRALKCIELKSLTPLTVLLGANGSGKSTVFDVFNFLSECFQFGLRHAWDRRGRAKELRTRGQQGPITLELKYRECPGQPLITYHLSIEEERKGPIVVAEWLQWRRGDRGKPFRFLEYSRGQGRAISGEIPDEKDKRVKVALRSPDLVAASTLGQLADHPRVAALREFITDWYIYDLSIDNLRSQPEAGFQERLSKTGDNLANVLQYLKEQHPDRLDAIFGNLRRRVPHIDRVLAEPIADGRLLLAIKDAPFEQPILAKFASEGTLMTLAYLLVLHDPKAPKLIGIEEPENFLHPRLPRELAEECRAATERSQLFVTTHSPLFVNGLHPTEVRIFYRDPQGFTQAVRSSDVRGIPEFERAGANLGDLWLESHFSVGDPLVNAGAPEKPGTKQ